MGIILDLILLLIFGLSVFFGYKRGLVEVIFSLFAFTISLIITLILYKPITNWVINYTEFDDNIKNTIIENEVIKDTEEEIESAANENIVNTYIQQYVTDEIIEDSNNLVEDMAELIAQKVITIIVVICLFIVVRLLMFLLKFVIAEVAYLPIIKQFNKLGGTIYGIILGLFLVYVILAILFFIVSVNNNQTIANTIDSSFITKILYANNFILNILF